MAYKHRRELERMIYERKSNGESLKQIGLWLGIPNSTVSVMYLRYKNRLIAKRRRR